MQRTKRGGGCTHLKGQATGRFAHTTEPTQANLTDLATATAESGFACGFAQDPDADRLAVVDEAGRYIGEEYTLALCALRILQREGKATMAANLSLYKNLKYDTLNDMASVVQTENGPYVISVHPSLPVKTVKDLVAIAKSKPGQLNYASTGNGGITQLSSELFALRTGIKITHIPYKGTGPGVIDTIPGPHGKPTHYITQPVTLERKPVQLVVTAPGRGQHTDEGLAEFGFSAAATTPLHDEAGGWEVAPYHSPSGPRLTPSPVDTRAPA